MISDNAARSQPARNSRRTLFKYCVCAWGLPAVVVVTCFALDYTDTVGIGYGMPESCCVAFFFFLLHKIHYRANKICLVFERDWMRLLTALV